MSTLYRIRLLCLGVPAERGEQAAIDVTEEFSHRKWHRSARAIWTDGVLSLYAENDYDDTGLALQDEFSDAVIGCVDLGDADISFRIHMTESFEEPETSFDPVNVEWVYRSVECSPIASIATRLEDLL